MRLVGDSAAEARALCADDAELAEPIFPPGEFGGNTDHWALVLSLGWEDQARPALAQCVTVFRRFLLITAPPGWRPLAM
jgi:hypothetical protein